MYERNRKSIKFNDEWGNKYRKKVAIAYELWQKGARGQTDYPKRLRYKRTIAGTPQNPVAIDTYENLYKCIDDEFYRILGIYSWFKSGIVHIDVSDLPYNLAVGLKYLIDYNEAAKWTAF